MNCTDCRAEGADCLTADRVRVCSDCLYERVVKERDEAKAEVERLRGVDCGVTEQDGTMTPLCNVCLECAFLRGAEAMREAAASQVFAFYAWSKDSEATRGDIKNLAEAIDALPVPEDEP